MIISDIVGKTFKHTNPRKAARPDEGSAFLLKNCPLELNSVWLPVFQASADTHAAWKTSYINPIPQIPSPKEHKGFRLIALTSVMKALERNLLRYLVSTMRQI